MIAYVDCLSTEPAGKCWNRTYYEDEDELLPLYTRKLNLQPKTEGSLRRRLLTSKIHQQQDALWAPRHWTGPPTRKGTPLQGQPNYTFSPSIHDWRGSTSNLVCRFSLEESLLSIRAKAGAQLCWHNKKEASVLAGVKT